MVAIDPGIRIRTTRSLPWTRTETACRYDAPEAASATCAAGSNPTAAATALPASSRDRAVRRLHPHPASQAPAGRVTALEEIAAAHLAV
jgi:hypothetical protein